MSEYYNPIVARVAALGGSISYSADARWTRWCVDIRIPVDSTRMLYRGLTQYIPIDSLDANLGMVPEAARQCADIAIEWIASGEQR